MKHCVEKLVQLLCCYLPLPCYPEQHAHVHTCTDSCETAFLDLILEPGEETHDLSLSVSDISHLKLTLSVLSTFN